MVTLAVTSSAQAAPCIFLGGPGKCWTLEDPALSKDVVKAISVARAWLVARADNANPPYLNYPITVVARDDDWVIMFLPEAPPGYMQTGGGPGVFVAKQDFSVIRAEWEQ